LKNRVVWLWMVVFAFGFGGGFLIFEESLYWQA
jgi:hypothetical protein